mmetsp:Transcript_24434/g.49884  ORF Transcript_24434/g.49884 Transcript_24434/m.49884 type:complete len:168 (+) Transcript_24434:3060-3563(+)
MSSIKILRPHLHLHIGNNHDNNNNNSDGSARLSLCAQFFNKRCFIGTGGFSIGLNRLWVCVCVCVWIPGCVLVLWLQRNQITAILLQILGSNRCSFAEARNPAMDFLRLLCLFFRTRPFLSHQSTIGIQWTRTNDTRRVDKSSPPLCLVVPAHTHTQLASDKPTSWS